MENSKRKLKKREVIYIILSAMFILYGILVRAVHTTHISFILWILLGMFFLVCFILSRKDFLNRIPRFLKYLILVILFAALAVFLFVEFCIIKGFVSAPPEKLDYIIVLGAKIYGDEPSPSLKYRLDAARDYLDKNPDTICILSGGQGKDENFPEAEIMFDYMKENGIPETRLITETESLDTVSNLKNSKKFITSPDAKTGVVSSNYHIFRAIKIAESQGYTDASGIPAKAPVLFVPHNMLKEFLSVLKGFVLGNFS